MLFCVQDLAMDVAVICMCGLRFFIVYEGQWEGGERELMR